MNTLRIPAFKMKNILSMALGLLAVSTLTAGTYDFYGEGISLFSEGDAVTSGSYAVRFGTYEEGVFTPYLGSSYNAANTGFISADDGEMYGTLTQSDNSNVPAFSQMYLSVSLISETSDYDFSAPQAILTDSTWLAPTFTLTSQNSFEFTSGTTAVVGAFDYNEGAPVISVAAVPEPAAAAALLGVAAIGICGLRRRRRAVD